ncbi:hypothetical protein LTR08_001162 [Meristemomyces frigidus]|nr:hypothetical protein LTR08_001162 [Meristemomyces frigidus]
MDMACFEQEPVYRREDHSFRARQLRRLSEYRWEREMKRAGATVMQRFGLEGEQDCARLEVRRAWLHALTESDLEITCRVAREFENSDDVVRLLLGYGDGHLSLEREAAQRMLRQNELSLPGWELGELRFGRRDCPRLAARIRVHEGCFAKTRFVLWGAEVYEEEGREELVALNEGRGGEALGEWVGIGMPPSVTFGLQPGDVVMKGGGVWRPRVRVEEGRPESEEPDDGFSEGRESGNKAERDKGEAGPLEEGEDGRAAKRARLE